MNSGEIKREMLAMEKLVDGGQLFNAIGALRTKPSWQMCGLDSRLASVEYAYSSMLDFYSSSQQDPQQDSIFGHVISELYDIIYQWGDNEALRNASPYIRYRNMNNLALVEAISYVRLYKESKILAEQSAQLDVVPAEMEASVRHLFDVVWSFTPNAELCDIVSDFITDVDVRIEDRGLIVGAVVLAVSQRFIPKYISLLFSLCHIADTTLRSKIIAGLMLCVVRHGDRIWNVGNLRVQWENLIGNIADKRALVVAMMAILKTVQTSDITEKMCTDVAPTILSVKELSDKTKGRQGFTSLHDIDWSEAVMGDKHLKKSIDKLMKWQTEGADIFLSTFSHLKDYQFFREVSNWLMPFDVHNSYLVRALADIPSTFRQSFLKGVTTAPMLCESDKYSVLMSFSYIPQNTRETICEMYTRELEVATEMMDGNMIHGTHNCVADQYIRDLYRLFYIHPRSKEFVNPFESLPDFVEHSCIFRTSFFDDEREAMGDYMGHNAQYAIAKRIYAGISQGYTTAAFLKKMVFCYMAEDDCQAALSLLDRLESIDGETEWVLKMRIKCYHFLRLTDSEARCLNALIAINASDVQLKEQLAACYMAGKQYDKALQLMYEVDYLQPTAQSALSVVDCMLRVGKGVDAGRYVTRINNADVRAATLSAFVQLCAHNISAATDVLLQIGDAIQNIDALIEYRKYQRSFENSNISIQDISFLIDIVLRQRIN